MTTPTKYKYYKPVEEISCPVCLKTYKRGNYEKHIQSVRHQNSMQLIQRFIQNPNEFSTQTVKT
jgi:hypothetical protein